MTKLRLDALLAQRGYYETRTKSQAAIMAGVVLVNNIKIDKPGTQVDTDAEIAIIGNKLPYVSRGGLKLEKALKVFHASVAGKVVADVGASTGGFTDCALQNGADRVYAIDVGYGQLAWKLRNDERVVNMERTNVRHMEEGALPEKVDIATIDVAFISLEKVLPAIKNFIKENGCVIALIKPQFEAGKEKVGKKGVVRDSAVHLEVITRMLSFARSIGFSACGLDYSPIKGPEGNIEYLLYLTFDKSCEIDSTRAQTVVFASHGGKGTDTED